MSFQLVGVSAENLRGYTATVLPLDRPTTVVVGRNNAGKTSVLRLLNWLLNDVDPLDLGKAWELPTPVADFLLPARHTRHKARRLALNIAVRDARRHSRFSCRDGIATLRLNIRLTPSPVAFLRLGEASRGERVQSERNAIELLRHLQEVVRLIYVPSFRDAASSRFQQTLRRTLDRRVIKKALHQTQGGAPAEYRQVKRALDGLASLMERLAKPLWPEMQARLPRGLAREGHFSLDCDVSDVVSWLTSQLTLRVATGDHDEATVAITELGSGLQSLLDLAIQQSDLQEASHQVILVVEEPESFLHPSAQRVVTRSLLRARRADRLIVTTHSSVVVDEARYGEVVICRDQRFYYPQDREDAEREEINSALLCGQGAEMLFARSVLLVEGESDRLFFEKLRRRLAFADEEGCIDELFVIAVGGKQSFGPWIRLLESYGSASDRPIRWLVVADGDAAPDVRRAFLDAGVSVPREVLDAMGHVGHQQSTGVTQWAEAIRRLNELTTSNATPFALLPVDLEHAALGCCSGGTLALFLEKTRITAGSLEDLLRELGSRAVAGSGRNKSPWIRGLMGARVPRAELSSDIVGVLRRWMAPVLLPKKIDLLLASPSLDAPEAAA